MLTLLSAYITADNKLEKAREAVGEASREMRDAENAVNTALEAIPVGDYSVRLFDGWQYVDYILRCSPGSFSLQKLLPLP